MRRISLTLFVLICPSFVQKDIIRTVRNLKSACIKPLAGAGHRYCESKDIYFVKSLGAAKKQRFTSLELLRPPFEKM
jgi:hypothetical protein